MIKSTVCLYKVLLTMTSSLKIIVKHTSRLKDIRHVQGRAPPLSEKARHVQGRAPNQSKDTGYVQGPPQLTDTRHAQGRTRLSNILLCLISFLVQLQSLRSLTSGEELTSRSVDPVISALASVPAPASAPAPAPAPAPAGISLPQTSSSLGCRLPCRNGTFESLPCSDNRPKLCQECSRSCGPGFFESEPCTPTHDIICRPCRKRCGRVDYEFTPCTGHQDRQCRGIDTLTKPTFAENCLWENQGDVKQVVSYPKTQDNLSPSNSWINEPITLKRGTEFSVQVVVKEANLAPLYTAVDHSRSNDNEAFQGDSRITLDYCAYPVPEKYQLSLVLHQGITTKAQLYVCNSTGGVAGGSGSGGGGGGGGGGKRSRGVRCDTETGYYLSPTESCQTYSTFGRLPSLNPSGRNIVCGRPGRLTDSFGVSGQLGDLTTMFVDKSIKCAEQRTSCDACSVMCARNMQSYKGSNRCNITADDSDNGESPRLQYCFSCCNKQDCSKLCEVYHDKDCQQLRCLTGNLAEFILTPIFSSRDTIFACHVQPVNKYKIYDIEYIVLHSGNPLNTRRLKAQRIFDKEHPQKAVDTHTFLKIHFGSEISSRPDLIEGDSSMKTFSAGHYQAKGQGLSGGGSEVMSRSLTVRPKTPFTVSSSAWKRDNCDTDMLAELVLASVAGYPDTDPYRRDAQLEVQHISPSTYRIFNKTHTYLPYISFEIPPDKSVLRPMFDPTTVSDDQSLRADLTRKENGWTLLVSGQLHRCPGSFEIIVRDPSYPQQPLFDYDVAVQCPNTFTIQFSIPTEGRDESNKTFLVQIIDSYRSIKITVYRPAPNITRDTAVQTVARYDKAGEIEIIVVTPIIALLVVIIIILSLFLFVGFTTESGRSLVSTTEGPTTHRLLFVVCYATFRATYSIAVTFTLLILIINHTNRESLGTLSEFSEFSETLESTRRIEMERIQAAMASEINRQNSLANQTKLICEQKLQQLQQLLEDSKQQMRVQSNKDRLVSQVALQYTRLMILNLTDNVNRFKEEFTSYASKSVDRLMKTMAQTSSAIQTNKWLAGAKVIYDVVKSKRSSLGLDTKSFLHWLGMDQDVERFVADLSLKDFPLPNLTDFLNIELPQSNERPSPFPRLSDVVLPRNQWYYQYEKKSGGSAGGGGDEAPPRSNPNRSETTTSPGDVISWVSFVAILAAIDFVWFMHRMARTYSTAKMILYGYPAVAAGGREGGGGGGVGGGEVGGGGGAIGKESTSACDSVVRRTCAAHDCLSCIKDFNFRIMRTDFVPKLVSAVTACSIIHIIIALSDRLLTVKALAAVGYFEAQVAPVETSFQLARTRIKTNSFRINRFEFPFYEDLVNVRTKRFQLLLEMYGELQRTGSVLRDSEYCAWKSLLSPEETCRCTGAPVVELKFDGCELAPVIHHNINGHDFGAYREDLSRSIVPYVNAARQLVMNSCHLVIIFITVIILVDLLGANLWIYLRRFGLLRIKPLVVVVEPDRVRRQRRGQRNLEPSTSNNHSPH